MHPNPAQLKAANAPVLRRPGQGRAGGPAHLHVRCRDVRGGKHLHAAAAQVGKPALIPLNRVPAALICLLHPGRQGAEEPRLASGVRSKSEGTWQVGTGKLQLFGTHTGAYLGRSQWLLPLLLV